MWDDVAGRHRLDQRYDVELLEDFRGWVVANTVCLPGSHYPSQVVSTIARYLCYSRRGAPFHQDAWRAVLDVTRVDEWLESYAAQRCSPSTLYNYVACLLKASHYCYGRLGMQTPAGYHAYLDAKKRVLRRRRRADETCRLDLEAGDGPEDLRPLCQAVLLSGRCDARMVQVVRAAHAYLAGEQASLNRRDFLFAMRYALAHTMLASAARPSALYTLRTEAVEQPVGHWADATDPLLLRNPLHKSTSYVGPCRLVVSGHGKRTLYLYHFTVRRAALLCWGLDSPYVFCNSRGKALNASQVSANLKALQRYCGVDKSVCATKIRKAVTSRLKLRARQNDPLDHSATTIASALCHSPPTNDRYYDLGRRDRQALEFHRMVVEDFLGGSP